jgi:uncharacterized phage protein (TIGR01671 family)
MRDIIFRGKRVDNGEWVYGAFVPDALEGSNDLVSWGFIRNYNKEIGHMQTIEVDRDTVGQFTGLCDKNGKKIFEGDIIELINADGETIRVLCEFGNAKRDIYGNLVEITGFYFLRNDGKKTFPIINNYAGKHDLELFEVIGNIHDNPNF